MLLLSLLLFTNLSFADGFLLTTQTPLQAQQTFSDLKIFPRLHPTTNFVVQFEFKVLKQNRVTNPNPWESFWFFWSYNKEPNQKKRTNYLAFKTNGLELGRAYDEVGQTFIWTDEASKIEINRWYKVNLNFSNLQLTISLDDKNIAVPADLLLKTYQNPGRIGLYSEDSDVDIKNFQLDYK